MYINTLRKYSSTVYVVDIFNEGVHKLDILIKTRFNLFGCF